MVSKTQRHVIEVVKRDGTDIAPLSLGKSRSAIGMHETRVYRQFLEHLDLVIDNYPVFERRLRHDKTVLTKLRRLWRMTRKED